MRRLVGSTIVILAVLTGCGSTPRSAARTAPATSLASAGFPVIVHAANGAVTIPARPGRILALSPTATQMLYAIGAGGQVAGVDKFSTDPPNAPRTQLTGGESAESYVSFHPDLVIVAFDTGGKLIAQLGVLRIPALLLPPAKTIDDTYGQLRQLGVATGHEAEASREITLIGQELDAITRSVGSRARGLTYYHEVDNTLYTATSKTFIGALYARLGMVNVADTADKSGSGYPQLSAEYLVKSDPDYIFLADTECCQQTAATVAARPGYAGMRAVRLGHIVAIPDPLASEWGPRVVDFLRDIADAVEGATSTTPSTA